MSDAATEQWKEEQRLGIDAEQGLLGSLLLHPDSFPSAAPLVRAEYFHEKVHQTVFEAISSCRKAGLTGTIGEVRTALGTQLAGTDIGGLDIRTYLGRLREDGATSSSAASYARAVRAHYGLRMLAGAVIDTGAAGLPDDRLKGLFDRIDALRSELGDAALSSAAIGSVASEVLERAIAVSEGLALEPGLTTGFVDIDRAMLGYRPGELVIMAGRPGMGKSTVGTSSAVKTSDPRGGHRCGGAIYFALELGREAVGARCLADIGYMRHESPTHSDIRAGRLKRHHIGGLREAECRLNELDLDIDDRSIATVGDIEAKCRAVQRRLERQGKRLGVVFVDYLKQVSSGDRYRGNRVYEIGEITAGLRGIAKRLGLCMVLLTQLNRGVENREDKRPTLGDLRESGDLENDADVVLLLYRPAYYLARELQSAEPDDLERVKHELEMAENKLEVIVGKNRNGAGEQTIPLWCDIGRSAVRDAARYAA